MERGVRESAGEKEELVVRRLSLRRCRNKLRGNSSEVPLLNRFFSYVCARAKGQ